MVQSSLKHGQGLGLCPDYNSAVRNWNNQKDKGLCHFETLAKNQHPNNKKTSIQSFVPNLCQRGIKKHQTKTILTMAIGSPNHLNYKVVMANPLIDADFQNTPFGCGGDCEATLSGNSGIPESEE